MLLLREDEFSCVGIGVVGFLCGRFVIWIIGCFTSPHHEVILIKAETRLSGDRLKIRKVEGSVYQKIKMNGR